MGTPAELVAEIRRDIQDIKEAKAAGNTSTVSTVFNLGGAGLVGGAFLGAIGIGCAIALYFKLESAYERMASRELVMAAERRADMAALSALMSRVEGVESQVRADRILITKAEQRLSKLEME